MENFEFVFDIKKYEFIDEKSGFIIHGEDIMMKETQEVIDQIYAGTGIEVDDFFVEILRDTIESCTPIYPFGN